MEKREPRALGRFRRASRRDADYRPAGSARRAVANHTADAGQVRTRSVGQQTDGRTQARARGICAARRRRCHAMVLGASLHDVARANQRVFAGHAAGHTHALIGGHALTGVAAAFNLRHLSGRTVRRVGAARDLRPVARVPGDASPRDAASARQPGSRARTLKAGQGARSRRLFTGRQSQALAAVTPQSAITVPSALGLGRRSAASASTSHARTAPDSATAAPDPGLTGRSSGVDPTIVPASVDAGRAAASQKQRRSHTGNCPPHLNTPQFAPRTARGKHPTWKASLRPIPVGVWLGAIPLAL